MLQVEEVELQHHAQQVSIASSMLALSTLQVSIASSMIALSTLQVSIFYFFKDYWVFFQRFFTTLHTSFFVNVRSIVSIILALAQPDSITLFVSLYPEALAPLTRRFPCQRRRKWTFS